jgi:hypothetical protein
MDRTLRIRGDAKANMAMTVERWIAACVLGCLVLAVALLPPQPDEDPFYRWTPEWSNQQRGLEDRAQSARIHGMMLWAAYRNAHDREIAQREFGGKPVTASHGGVSIWFDADVPEAARRSVTKLLTPAHSGLGNWQGKSDVGVLVFTDTAATVGGMHLPWGYNSGLIASTKVLPASRETGGRCITIIRLGHLVLNGGGAVGPDQGLLDGCAFYDAFGTPGPRIAEWLERGRFSFARSLSFETPDSATAKAEQWGADNYLWSDEKLSRCGGNDLAGCSALLQQLDTSFMWKYWHDGSVPQPAESPEISQRARGLSATLLNTMVREIGPERFQRVWQSPRSLDSAYFDATGEQLAVWTHRRIVAFDGPYHIGPLPTATSAILTILAILVSLALSARFARRPAAA